MTSGIRKKAGVTKRLGCARDAALEFTLAAPPRSSAVTFPIAQFAVRLSGVAMSVFSRVVPLHSERAVTSEMVQEGERER